MCMRAPLITYQSFSVLQNHISYKTYYKLDVKNVSIRLNGVELNIHNYRQASNTVIFVLVSYVALSLNDNIVAVFGLSVGLGDNGLDQHTGLCPVVSLHQPASDREF